MNSAGKLGVDLALRSVVYKTDENLRKRFSPILGFVLSLYPS